MTNQDTPTTVFRPASCPPLESFSRPSSPESEAEPLEQVLRQRHGSFSGPVQDEGIDSPDEEEDTGPLIRPKLSVVIISVLLYLLFLLVLNSILAAHDRPL
jgi:hypothetical protein